MRVGTRFLLLRNSVNKHGEMTMDLGMNSKQQWSISHCVLGISMIVLIRICCLVTLVINSYLTRRNMVMEDERYGCGGLMHELCTVVLGFFGLFKIGPKLG